jgi:hypothetical protein
MKRQERTRANVNSGKQNKKIWEEGDKVQDIVINRDCLSPLIRKKEKAIEEGDKCENRVKQNKKIGRSGG